MTPERFQELKAVFVELVERERTAREEALSALASRDPELAEEARGMLRGSAEASTRLLARVAMSPLAVPGPDPSALVGRRLGPYRLTAALGGGGMGDVYSAVRDEDGKRVAVKILRGPGDADELARTVGAERRILAGLEHDNIARLIDGGVTPDGQPYFTMEHVDGSPIVAFCEERGLDVAARLGLFRSLAAAVHYAHQRLVVHCDIKPSNVLVTAAGVPKLLDFGIARLLRPPAAGGEPKASGLASGMTPAYAAPEQVRGEPVSTATDVYALGLLLYELLAGVQAQPLKTLGYAEIVETVCRAEPPRPSAVAPKARRRRIEGDLDAIVLAALRKEPAERYESAQALAADLDRFLALRPVAARRGTWRYRTGRFLRRNWLSSGAAALVAALTVAAVVATTVQARRIDRERNKAERISEFLVGIFAVADPDEARGDTITARQLLDAGASRISSELAEEPDVRATLLDTIGRVYVNLGLYSRATELHREALELRRKLFPPRSPEIADGLERVARSLYYEDRWAESEALHREALELRREELDAGDPAIARSLDEIAKAVGDQGRYAEAESLHRQSLARYRAAFGDHHPEVATALGNLASDLYDLGRYAAAGALNREALAMRQETLGPDHRLVAWSQNNLANCFQELGRYEEAELHHREALATLRRLHGDEHPEVALILGNLAVDLYKQSRYAEAEAAHREGLRQNVAQKGRESFAVAASLFNLAEVVASQDRFEEAGRLFAEAHDLFAKLLGPDHPYCARGLIGVANVLAARGEAEEAVATAKQALALLRQRSPPPEEDLGEAEAGLAVALAAAGRLEEAEALLADAHDAGADGISHLTRAVLAQIAARLEAAGRAGEAARCRRLLPS